MAMESKDYQRCHSIADPTFRRVIQDDWLRPKLADWVTRLEEEAAACATPPVLAAPQPRLLAGRALVLSLAKRRSDWPTRSGASEIRGQDPEAGWGSVTAILRPAGLHSHTRFARRRGSELGR